MKASWGHCMLLYIPYFENNKNDFHTYSGYGHLIRCIKMAVHSGGCILLATQYHSIINELLQQYISFVPKKNQKHKPHIISEINQDSYDAIILDMKESSKHQVHALLHYGPVIGIDLGGEGRKYASYLIDTLPNKLNATPNIYNLELSVDPYLLQKDGWSSSCKHILYYTDGQYLDDELVFLTQILTNTEIEISILTSEPSKYKTISQEFSHCHILPVQIDFIPQHIKDYDVFITHFGISSYEALAAHVPVIMCNKSKYHSSLSTIAQFPVIYTISHKNSKDKISSVYKKLADYVMDISNNPDKYAELILHTKSVAVFEQLHNPASTRPSLANLITKLATSYNDVGQELPINPWLGITCEQAVYRNESRSIFLCRKTGQWHQLVFSNDKFPTYDDNYFSDEYKKQYGRTYIEDYNFILKKMRERMKYIHKFLTPPLKTKKTAYINKMTGEKAYKYEQEKDNPIVCDLGCAYGTMLQASGEYGYNSIGIEVNEHAVAYIKRVLQAKAIVGNIEKERVQSLLSQEKLTSKIAVVTAFFVVEHVKNFQLVLNDIHDILEIGGVCAFSVPNGAGISAKKSLNAFLEHSPLDHFSIFTPAGMCTILKKSGFKIKKIRVTGHHPERFGISFLPMPILDIISKIFKLGDTFEVYAVKQW